MAKTKTSALWTVRNLRGQYIGTYRAYTAEQAIGRLITEQAMIASTFRKSQPMHVTASEFVATVKGESP